MQKLSVCFMAGLFFVGSVMQPSQSWMKPDTGMEAPLKNVNCAVEILAAIEADPTRIEEIFACKDGDGDNLPRTPLMIFSFVGWYDLVEKLIKARVNINKRSGWWSRFTALMFAVMGEREKVVQLLISAGANLDMAQIDGWTALTYAVFLRNEKICKMLLQAGASIPNGLTSDVVGVEGDNIEWLDSVIIKMNEELDAEMLSMLNNSNVMIPVFEVSRTMSHYPLASKVYAERAAAAPNIQRHARGMQVRKKLIAKK